MNTEELCDYLKEQGVEDADIQIIKASSYKGDMILSMMRNSPKKVEAMGLSVTCVKKLKAWKEYMDYRSTQEAKARQKKISASKAAGGIVYHTPMETQEVVIRLGYDNSDED